jgi:hypothetical protein
VDKLPESGNCLKAYISAASCHSRPNAPQQTASLFDRQRAIKRSQVSIDFAWGFYIQAQEVTPQFARGGLHIPAFKSSET